MAESANIISILTAPPAVSASGPPPNNTSLPAGATYTNTLTGVVYRLARQNGLRYWLPVDGLDWESPLVDARADVDNADHYYYGVERGDGSWAIYRYPKATLSVETADAGAADLAAAWPLRTTLTYS